MISGNNQLTAALGVAPGEFASGTGFYSTPAKQHEFLQVMHTFACVDAPAVLGAVDFSQYKTICDLGGECLRFYIHIFCVSMAAGIWAFLGYIYQKFHIWYNW